MMTEKIEKGNFPPGCNHFLQQVLTKIQQARYEMLMSAGKQTLFYAKFGISATTVAEIQVRVFDLITNVGWV